MKFNITKKHIIFLIVFAILVFVGRRINFSPIIGAENQFFTLFQFIGPIAGAFLGPIVGAVSVLFAHGTDYILAGKAFTLINLIRLTPMLFAAYYFGARKRFTGKIVGVIVPAAAMIAFMLHPVGREAWVYSMFWLIPIFIALLPVKQSNNLILKSFGATFTAHCVGSIAFLYTVGMTPDAWMALIPVVIFERTLLAMGIIGSYVGMNAVLHYVADKFNVPADVLHIDKNYLLSKLFKAKA